MKLYFEYPQRIQINISTYLLYTKSTFLFSIYLIYIYSLLYTLGGSLNVLMHLLFPFSFFCTATSKTVVKRNPNPNPNPNYLLIIKR